LAQIWGSRKNAPDPRKYQIGVHLFYAYNIPSSIGAPSLFSEVSSGSSSAGGDRVNVRGRDGSGRIKSLLTIGLFNLISARLCVGSV
jgi:hypothetical protein